MNKAKFDHILKTQLPIAWIAGVRFGHYDNNTFSTYVEFDFLNQNPFGSMFWAVEGMAAEFCGGMMLLEKIEATGKSFSTLVVKNEVVFTKKAIGKITFTCNQGALIEQELKTAIETNEPRTFTLTSIGIDEAGDQVANFAFTWSIKMRNK